MQRNIVCSLTKTIFPTILKCKNKILFHKSILLFFYYYWSSLCFPLVWNDITKVSVWAWHSQSWPVLNYLFVHPKNTFVESKQQMGRARSLSCSFIWDIAMGQSQPCPTRVASSGGLQPPSPRTVPTLHLVEPSQRFCYYHQHFPFSFPERVVNYSPPYSPSLFKRPDRR